MMQSTISFSFLFLMFTTLVYAISLDQIEHCELDCPSTTVDGLNVVGNCVPKCSEGVKIPNHIEKKGQDEIKQYLDNLFSNALFGSHSSETQQTQATDPLSFSFQTDQIPKHEGEGNMDVEKLAYKLPKTSGEEKLVDEDIAVNVGLEIVGDGEYVLKIKRVNPSSTGENEVERAKQMAQNGAMLVLYGEMLHDMGEKLLVQSQTSLYSLFKMPSPPKSKSHHE